MTSPLRRKRPITVSSILLRKTANRFRRPSRLIAIACFGVYWAASSSVAWSQNPGPENEPQRFVPPVHAKPLRTTAANPMRKTHVRQVSATQYDDYPADQWRTRKTASQDFEQWGFADESDQDSAPLLNGNRSQRLDPPNFDDQKVAPSREQRQYGQSVLIQTTPPNAGEAENQLRIDPERPASPAYSTSSVNANVHSRTPTRDTFLYQDPVDLESPGRGMRSCDEYRDELLNQPITDIVLDFSPKRPTNIGRRAAEQQSHDWSDCWGNPLGSGVLVGLSRSYIVIETDSGQQQKIALTQLSDSDLEMVTQYWAIPTECSLGCYRFEGRNWLPHTIHWKASGLCHKPLYFEDIQLERYGHSHGPVLQPIHSTAHFFASLLVVPYQMGIHPPNECLYALGFYRPGNCAPWLKDPIPLSLTGSLYQAGAVAGFLYATP